MKKLTGVGVAAVILAGLWLVGRGVEGRSEDARDCYKAELFRCRDCDGNAFVSRCDPERWSCPGCGISTYDLHRKFKMGDQAEFLVEGGECKRILRQAGVLHSSDAIGPSLLEIYNGTKRRRYF
jgi:hypothetical protein